MTGPLAGAVLDHVGTEETDIDARVGFLVELLGFQVLRWGVHVVTGRRIAMLADPRGTKLELMEVVELAKRGAINIHVEQFSLDEAPAAYEKLHAGQVRGRAVIVP